jgi:DNA-binding NarL/FixJ family response regulator
VVGVAASGDEAVRLAEALRPDLAIVDISLGEESGFDVARRLVDNSPADPLAIIFVSTYDQREFTGRIAASPALGFIPKTQLSAERIRALLGD